MMILDKAETAYWIWRIEKEMPEVSALEAWGKLKEQIECVRDIARENGSCPNWGMKANGHFGPCGHCEFCNEFQND